MYGIVASMALVERTMKPQDYDVVIRELWVVDGDTRRSVRELGTE